MLNHKFYLPDSNKSDVNDYIRISDEFIKKMKPDLMKYKFTWSGYEEPQYGLNRGVTIIKPIEVNQLKDCLLKQPQNQKEYNKFMRLINCAILEKKELYHEGGESGKLAHDFVICSKLPEEINYTDYKDSFVSIQDQFIRENYDIFEKVNLYWENMQDKKPGLNYYGISIIFPDMAIELIETMNSFIRNDKSEKADYFVGDEYDFLLKILNQSALEKQYIIHFGV